MQHKRSMSSGVGSVNVRPVHETIPLQLFLDSSKLLGAHGRGAERRGLWIITIAPSPGPQDQVPFTGTLLPYKGMSAGMEKIVAGCGKNFRENPPQRHGCQGGPDSTL